MQSVLREEGRTVEMSICCCCHLEVVQATILQALLSVEIDLKGQDSSQICV